MNKHLKVLRHSVPFIRKTSKKKKKKRKHVLKTSQECYKSTLERHRVHFENCLQNVIFVIYYQIHFALLLWCCVSSKFGTVGKHWGKISFAPSETNLEILKFVSWNGIYFFPKVFKIRSRNIYIKLLHYHFPFLKK